MTKAELILKIAKNVGVPDTDTKKFFELFLKKISAVIDVGQSVFVKEFGYFHLIKGSIKKPVFSFKDNEVSEEEVELVLFSEDKDLKKSDTKGLVFNIPIFDDEDFHPIDSAFSLSIGKPLIPLRGVPFDDIYVPTSGYEYKRLIESKVEKLVAASEIIETEEKFPTLVIDARSYNTNQVQLQWSEMDDSEALDHVLSDDFVEEKQELSEYEKQSKELKNIAWDFGEDLSQQIEAESILDIADERLKHKSNQIIKDKKETEKIFEEETEKVIEQELQIIEVPATIEQPEIISDVTKVVETNEEFVEEVESKDSSAKLDELLSLEIKTNEFVEEKIMNEQAEVFEDSFKEEENVLEIEFDKSDETKIEDSKSIEEEIQIVDEPSDKDFWNSTSKYFETYNPNVVKDEIKYDPENELVINEEVQDEIEIENQIEENNLIDEQNEEVIEEVIEQEETQNSASDIIESENKMNDEIQFEKIEEQKPEFYEPEKKRNLVPFIVFPLLVIIASIGLYWYLEYYKKNENSVKPKQVNLKVDNANVISRNFDIPISYPYKPKENQTILTESTTQKNEEQNIVAEKLEENKIEQNKPEEKKLVEKQTTKVETKTETKPVTQNIQTKTVNKETLPTSKSLNVGNNIYKYGNYYVVQVAAFRSNTISDNEAGKYRNKGYNAFVESAEIPDRGTWYRVRVGNFSSKEEAQKFLEKIIR